MRIETQGDAGFTIERPECYSGCTTVPYSGGGRGCEECGWDDHAGVGQAVMYT